ncbi:MAG: CHAD domain-containing protein [Candidatus Omnitrophica bacterium]|nr:CHAD domain-containing protein [Candidatus Omnitrophota bacterium]
MKPQKHLDREIECKWKALSIQDYEIFLAAAKKMGGRISKPQHLLICDLYLDTPDKFFGHSRTKCRIRLTNKKSEITLKNFSISKQGLVTRHEKSISIPHFDSEHAALAYCRKHIFRNLLGHMRIKPIFKLTNHRLIRKLTLPDGTSAESCFDDVVISRSTKKVHMFEIELEYTKGNLETFKNFAAKLTRVSKLKPQTRSKFATAMSQLFGETHIPSDPRQIVYPYRYTKYDSLGFVAKQIVRANLNRMKTNEAGVRLNIEEESLHDMRVAARRIRAALRLFKKALPSQASKIAYKLRRFGYLLGRKRDLDILSAHANLSSEIGRAHQAILRELNSPRYAKLIRSIETLDSRSKKLEAKKMIQKRLDKVLSEALSITPKSSDKELHRLRITIKKLRYACEFLESVSLPKTRKLIDSCRQIQDILGAHQDAILGLKTFPRNKLFRKKKKEARLQFEKEWKGFLLRLLRF